uniref:Uncharacterized protein n=1 Tax=Coturnix japonica TaxID=93934 RepID=A0A8C2SYP4_COTJA
YLRRQIGYFTALPIHEQAQISSPSPKERRGGGAGEPCWPGRTRQCRPLPAHSGLLALTVTAPCRARGSPGTAGRS